MFQSYNLMVMVLIGSILLNWNGLTSGRDQEGKGNVGTAGKYDFSTIGIRWGQ